MFGKKHFLSFFFHLNQHPLPAQEVEMCKAHNSYLIGVSSGKSNSTKTFETRFLFFLLNQIFIRNSYWRICPEFWFGPRGVRMNVLLQRRYWSCALLCLPLCSLRLPRCWPWLWSYLHSYGCPTAPWLWSIPFSPDPSKKTGSCYFAESVFI